VNDYFNSKVYSVSALNRHIKEILEDSFPALWVEGEISNFRPHYSGHLYFTLKDTTAQISCVMWKSRATSIPLELGDGMQVKVLGYVKVYEKSGRYQLDLLRIMPAGIGELQILFEKLKQKLLAEGLFENEHKKEIPKFPERIGIITSPTGAAITDLISILKKRSPSTEIIVRGVKVQGEGASDEIAASIELFNELNLVDVLIVGRGGGSLEDLWAFNEEKVARAIFQSKIPVISAVGHEIDFTISDFVADLRAPTPSAAAEMAVQNDEEIRKFVIDLRKRALVSIKNIIKNYLHQIKSILQSYAFNRPEDIVRQFSQRVDELTQRMTNSVLKNLKNMGEQLFAVEKHLSSLNPGNVLKRGYSMILLKGSLVSSVNQVEVKDEVEMKLKDGKLKSLISEKNYEQT